MLHSWVVGLPPWQNDDTLTMAEYICMGGNPRVSECSAVPPHASAKNASRLEGDIGQCSCPPPQQPSDLT